MERESPHAGGEWLREAVVTRESSESGPHETSLHKPRAAPQPLIPALTASQVFARRHFSSDLRPLYSLSLVTVATSDPQSTLSVTAQL